MFGKMITKNNVIYVMIQFLFACHVQAKLFAFNAIITI